MKKFKLISLFALLMLVSCKKEVFPKKKNIIGTWVEQTNNSFKHKLVFEEDVLYFTKSSRTDTSFYSLDKEKKVLSLTLVNSPSGISTEHKILINKKNNELTIWGLFISTPENISETVFKKE
jgi:hypothetical protein